MLVLLLACRNDHLLVELDSGALDPIDSALGDSADSAPIDSEPLDTGDFVPTADWCIDWEDGSLEQAGYSEGYVELGNGALLWNVMEGTDFSALVGEDLLDFRGARALVMRSSHSGEVASVAIATTEPFLVESPHLWWYHLSEVGDDGVDLYADLMAEGAVLGSLDDLAQTGGYVPALQDEHIPISGFPDIGYGDPTIGEMVWHVTDVEPWLGQEVRLRLYQHTTAEGQGFFTIIDDICMGTAFQAEFAWDEPNPDH